jgi:hypothetical protein
MGALTPAVIRAARMTSLLLADHEPRTPLSVAEWFGAMQAQDVASGQWSLGLRVRHATVADVEAAFERGGLIRTWPMRQTVHIVPAVDARWMLELTGTRGLDRTRTRRQQLGLLPADLDRLLIALEAFLEDGEPRTRREVLDALAAEGIPTDGQRGYHLLLYASLLGITCIGPQRDGSQTIVLLSAWAPQQVQLTRDEALVELAHRYFRSHGPTTVKDFAGWTGLTLTDARRGVEGNAGRVERVGEGARAVWLTTELANAISDGRPADHRTLALPGFDEYVLGYKDRSLHGDESLLDRVVPGGNGVFRATIVRHGSVIATWTRTLARNHVRITVHPFAPLSGRARTDTERALGAFADYLGREPVITIPASA